MEPTTEWMTLDLKRQIFEDKHPKIELIKVIRGITGLSLKRLKPIVDDIMIALEEDKKEQELLLNSEMLV